MDEPAKPPAPSNPPVIAAVAGPASGRALRGVGLRSLAVKGAFGLLLLALLLAGAVLAVMNTYGKQLVLAESARRIEETGNKSVEQLSTRLREIASLTRTLAATSGELPPDVENAKSFLPPLIDFQGDVAVAGGGYWPEPNAFIDGIDRRSFFWGRDKANVLQYFEDYNAPLGPGYRNEEWYVPVTHAKPGSVFWSKSYMDPYSYQPMVTCAANVHRGGKLLGTTTIDLKLEDLTALAKAWQEDIGGYAFVVDRNNKFLSYPDESKVKLISTDEKGNRTEEFIDVRTYAAREPLFEPIANAIADMDQAILDRARRSKGFDPGLAAKIDAESYQINAAEAEYIAAVITDPLADLRKGGPGRPGTYLFNRFEIANDSVTREPSFAYVFTVPDAHWKVVLVTPLSVASAVAVQITNTLVAVIAAIITLLLVITYFVFARPQLARILGLARAALRVRDGDLEARAAVKGGDELGLLGATFNEMVGKLKTYTRDLEDVNRNLESKVAERTAELQRSLDMTETIMSTVHEGLFLIDAQFRIEPQYSKELETILGSGSLQSVNFLDLIRQLTPEKTHELASRFLKLLFDSKKNDSVIPKVNPLKEIETTLQLRDGRFDQKFLTFNFDRVWEGGEIKQALVTVVDITARVMLARELKDSERKMERQAALLLSVMHVEASMLKDFIEGAHDEMQAISAMLREENSETSPLERQRVFREQLNRIYRGVHTIKGTASMLKIGYFETTAHELEQKLQNLQRRSVLDGNDFVPIVLDLSELIDSLAEIRDVIGRFAQAQGPRQSRSEATVLSEALEQFVGELGAKQGKRARLAIQFADGSQVPFKHRKVVRDVMAQLVRNSMVHGIETPAERAAAGKREEGEIFIGVRQVNGSLELLYRDDGRGLDYSKIVARVRQMAKDDPAIMNGLILDAEKRQWRLEALNELIFRPGFSTVEGEAAMDAGRGMGMTAVKEMITSSGGQVTLRSFAGKACEFKISLPV
jgi:HAMP domain-containing protein/HPt (histidine-containing phosphotransfer) domain-containing protein